MPLLGIAEFNEPYLLDYVWIDGTWVHNVPMQVEMAPGLFALPTHGGTHVMQRLYRGDLKPADYSALRFSMTIRAALQAAWYAVKTARAKGAPFYFAPGIRQVDYFAATTGSTYRLTRPLATGIVTGITSGTHPTVVRLNGSVDPSAATVTGQDVVAAATGAISVEYTPAHLVYFASFNESIGDHNLAELNVTLEEVLVS